MNQKFTAALLAGALILTGAFFTGCNGDGDTQFTNPTINTSNTSRSEEQPQLKLEHYSDSQTEDDSRRRAVSVTFSDYLMGEMTENGMDVKSLQMDEVNISDFENGFVADISMTVETDDGQKKDRRVLGYFKTVRLADGTYRTYFIYYSDIGQNDQIDDKTKEEQLNNVLDKVQQEDNAASSASSSASSAQSGTQNSGTQSSSQNSDENGSNPEKINDVDIDDLL